MLNIYVILIQYTSTIYKFTKTKIQINYNKMFIGGCSDCSKSCLEADKGNYRKNHTGSHDVYNKSQVIKSVNNHIEIIAGKVCDRKVIMLKEYFKDVHSKIDQIRNRKIDEMLSMKTQVAFSIGQEKNSKDLTKFADMCINGKIADLKCSNAGFLMRGLYRMDKNLRNGDNIQYQIFNRVFKQTKNQIDNILRSLENSYLQQAQKLNNEMQKLLRTLISQNKLPNNVPEKVQKADNIRETNMNIITVAKQKQYERDNPLLKKKITLVKQAPQKIQFAVRVKITKICTTIDTKRGQKIIFLARDSSGTQQLAFRKHQYITQGNQVIIQRCKIQDIKGKNKIVSIYDSDIYLLPQQTERRPRQREDRGQFERGQDRDTQKRNGGQDRRDNGRGGFHGRGYRKMHDRNSERDKNRRGQEDNPRLKKEEQQKRERRDRDTRRDNLYDRREDRRDNRQIDDRERREDRRKQLNKPQDNRDTRNNNDQRRPPRQKAQQNPQKTVAQRFRKQQQQQSYQKIQDITPDSQNITIQVKVHQIKVQIKQNLICMIGDETAIVQAQLPAKYDCVIEGGSVIIKGAYAQVRAQHIIIVVKPDSRLKKSLKAFSKIGIGKNISLENWVEDND